MQLLVLNNTLNNQIVFVTLIVVGQLKMTYRRALWHHVKSINLGSNEEAEIMNFADWTQKTKLKIGDKDTEGGATVRGKMIVRQRTATTSGSSTIRYKCHAVSCPS